MKQLIAAVVFVAMMVFGVSASAQTVKVPERQAMTWKGKSIDDYYRYVGPDIDIQAGAGYHWDTASKSQDAVLGMGRIRMGVLHIPHWPWAFSAGLTMEPNSLSAIVWGGQAEVLHLGSGLWARAGGGSDIYVRPHFNAAVGYSLIGIEIQGFSAGDFAPNVLNDHREGVAILAVGRIPLGYLFYVFNKNK